MINASLREGCLPASQKHAINPDHHTAAEEAVARQRRDEELSTSLEPDVHL